MILFDIIIPNCLFLGTSLYYPLTLSAFTNVINTKQFGEHNFNAYLPIDICFTCFKFKFNDYFIFF